MSTDDLSKLRGELAEEGLTDRPPENPEPLALIVGSPEDVSTEAKIDKKGTEITAHYEVARQVADLMKQGLSVPAIEKEMHLTLEGPNRNMAISEKLQKILVYEMNPDMRKRAVKARLNQVLIEGDFDQAVKAAKEIANDPEVGLAPQQSGTQVGVAINFSEETLSLFAKLSDEKQ